MLNWGENREKMFILFEAFTISRYIDQNRELACVNNVKYCDKPSLDKQ